MGQLPVPSAPNIPASPTCQQGATMQSGSCIAPCPAEQTLDPTSNMCLLPCSSGLTAFGSNRCKDSSGNTFARATGQNPSVPPMVCPDGMSLQGKNCYAACPTGYTSLGGDLSTCYQNISGVVLNPSTPGYYNSSIDRPTSS